MWHNMTQHHPAYLTQNEELGEKITQGNKSVHVYHPGRNYYKIIPWNIYICKKSL